MTEHITVWECLCGNQYVLVGRDQDWPPPSFREWQFNHIRHEGWKLNGNLLLGKDELEDIAENYL